MTTQELHLHAISNNTASNFKNFCVDENGDVHTSLANAKAVFSGLQQPSGHLKELIPYDTIVSSHLTTFDAVFDGGTRAVFLSAAKIGAIAAELITEVSGSLTVKNVVLEILDIKHSYIVDSATKYISVFTITANAYFKV